ncbi:MAG: hypothetical protein J5857_05735, partial [Treponema sp.]|nr:hypothetical protein [Treponema sp.]
NNNDEDDAIELKFDSDSDDTQTTGSKNENGKVVVELNLSEKSNTEKSGDSKAETKIETKVAEIDEDIEEYSTAQFIQLVHDLTKMENSADLVPDSVEGMKADQSYYISDGDNIIYFAPFGSLPYVYIRIGEDGMNYGLVLAGPNANAYRSVLLSSGETIVGQNADNMFDNASIKELYDFIRSEFPVSCIVKTKIHGKDYNIYCGMDEYDSSLDFSFEEN